MTDTQTLIAKLVTGKRRVILKSVTNYYRSHDSPLKEVKNEQFLIKPNDYDDVIDTDELTDVQRLAIVALTTNDKSAWSALCDYLQETLTGVSNE